jgi:beta-lactamase superfamily II metal-dependent hydrolase
MDDNTTKVVLAAIVLAFVVAIMRQFDRVSLHVQRLRLDIFGVLSVGASVLSVVMQRRRRSNRSRAERRGDVGRSTGFIQGSFARTNTIQAMLGSYDIDIVVVTHPDDDHLYGLLR